MSIYLLTLCVYNNAREAAREAARIKDAAMLLGGVLGEYLLSSTFEDVEGDMRVTRSIPIRATVFAHNGKSMFKLDGDQMGIPVAMLQYKTAENYQPLNNLPISLQNEMKNCFFYVYNAVKAAVHEAAAKRAAANASAKQQHSGNHFKSNNSSGAKPKSATRQEILANMTRNAKCGREAVLGLAAEKYGTYNLGEVIFSLVDTGGKKILRFEGLTKEADKTLLPSLLSGSFIPLWVLANPEYKASDALQSAAKDHQMQIHAFVHKFAAENGVHAKVKPVGALRFTGHLRRGHASASYVSA